MTTPKFTSSDMGRGQSAKSDPMVLTGGTNHTILLMERFQKTIHADTIMVSSQGCGVIKSFKNTKTGRNGEFNSEVGV